jgi:hypothetical protein
MACSDEHSSASAPGRRCNGVRAKPPGILLVEGKTVRRGAVIRGSAGRRSSARALRRGGRASEVHGCPPVRLPGPRASAPGRVGRAHQAGRPRVGASRPGKCTWTRWITSVILVGDNLAYVALCDTGSDAARAARGRLTDFFSSGSSASRQCRAGSTRAGLAESVLPPGRSPPDRVGR